MEKNEREVLLHPGSLSNASRVFEIPVGGELTFVAMGLHEDDYVHFELVYAPSIEKEPCACPPPTVTPPVITAKSILQYDGVPVVLRKDNPFCVLKAPQGQPMRAVRHVNSLEDLIDFRLTMQYTENSSVDTVLAGVKEWQVEDNLGINDTVEGA